MGTEYVWECSKWGVTLNFVFLAIDTDPISADTSVCLDCSFVSFVLPHPAIHTVQRDSGYIMKSHSLLCHLMCINEPACWRE